ncbi:ATP12 family chaperone protein [Rhodopila sp.]|uniref:ATP12 family chaperone protein n=1 Tax=Rhodopila sp. TaxID=2480087 RepID=UPI002C0BD348|nr:ATP12 family protein [Rhodopila sp.]HVZ10436.1 ATP12 family protein [Rhodopila sp.]
MKRFWEVATIEAEADGYSIHLDGRPIRLPGGNVLTLRPERLARAIADEWQQAGLAKGGEMSFENTPLTRLAGTAQERIAPNPDPTIDAIARYGESDLLCYRAESPQALVDRQAASWQPWLDWIARAHGAPLRVTAGVGYIKQHHDSIDTLKRIVAAQDAYVLAGLGIAVPALGSLVLGLALAQGALDADTAADLGALDELFQVELWGEDEEAQRRRGAVRAEIALAGRFMALSREGGG